MQKKLTIQDIARLAGVSKATVSRVLNHNPSVDPFLSERVNRVVREQGFVPNVTATGLAGGRTRLIGVLAPPLNWPAIPEIMRGVAEYIEDTSYEIVLYSVRFERNHSDVLDRILAMRMVSGLLAILPGELLQHLASHFEQGLPMVVIDDQEQPSSIPWVGIDNTSSAYQATRHLLDLGYRRIAHMMGPQSYFCAHERYQGYCQALREAGITPDPALLYQGDFETESGRHCAHTLFASERESWPEAIFAGNDEMAYGILEVAEHSGIRVPEQIAVVGFDDTILSAYMRPPLTTVRQPFSEMGREAIEVLLTMIEPDHRLSPDPQGLSSSTAALRRREHGVKQSQDHPVRLQLPTSLVVRASSTSSISSISRTSSTTSAAQIPSDPDRYP